MKLGIQTYRTLTNDDEVCIPSLSSIPFAVLVDISFSCRKDRFKIKTHIKDKKKLNFYKSELQFQQIKRVQYTARQLATKQLSLVMGKIFGKLVFGLRIFLEIL